MAPHTWGTAYFLSEQRGREKTVIPSGLADSGNWDAMSASCQFVQQRAPKLTWDYARAGELAKDEMEGRRLLLPRFPDWGKGGIENP